MSNPESSYTPPDPLLPSVTKEVAATAIGEITRESGYAFDAADIIDEENPDLYHAVSTLINELTDNNLELSERMLLVVGYTYRALRAQEEADRLNKDLGPRPELN